MSSQDLDVMYVQNPALGTVLLWRFTCGYYSNENRPVPFPLLFVVLPIVFRQDLCSVIKSTQKASGLSKVSEKLFSGKLNDSIHYVNNTAISWYYGKRNNKYPVNCLLPADDILKCFN